MKFSAFVKNNVSLFKTGIRRFASIFWLSVAAFVLCAIQIITESYEDMCVKLYMGLFFGVVASFAMTLFAEKYKPAKQTVFSWAAGITGGAICFALVHIFYDYTPYIAMAYTGVCLTILCICLWLLVRGENKNEVLPYILRRLFFAGEIGVVLSIGVSVCIAAFSALVFDFDDVYKVYLTVLAFIWIVIAFNLFIAGIPDENTVYGEAKLFKAIVLYAAFPVYMLLLAILYIYFIKILVTLKLPSGEINWFSSFASLFFVFFVFCLRQYKTKITDLFVKYGGVLMLPVSAMQFTALFVRINAYGYTISRIVSLILATIAIVFAAGFMVLRKKPETVFLFAASVVFVFTALPKINLVDVSIASQTNRIEKTLEKNVMLENGEIVPKSDISVEDKETIASAYRYINGFDLKQRGILKPLEKSNFEDVFGFESKYYYLEQIYCYYNSTIETIDVSDYSYMAHFDCYGTDITFSAGGVDYTFDMTGIYQQYYTKYGESTDEIEPFMLTDDICVYPEGMHFGVNKVGEYIPEEYSSIRGYALIK